MMKQSVVQTTRHTSVFAYAWDLVW